MAEALMAKKKAVKSTLGVPTSRRLSVQATEDWIAWLVKGADHCRTDISKLVDAAVAQYLKAQGFEDKPPRRIP